MMHYLIVQLTQSQPLGPFLQKQLMRPRQHHCFLFLLKLDIGYKTAK